MAHRVSSISLTACAGNNDEGNADKNGKYEIALVTDYGSVDDKSFNQGAWEGLTDYAKKKISHISITDQQKNQLMLTLIHSRWQ